MQVRAITGPDRARWSVPQLHKYIARAVKLGLEGAQLDFARNLGGRLLSGGPAIPHDREIVERFFAFWRDGGTLRGQHLTGPKRWALPAMAGRAAHRHVANCADHAHCVELPSAPWEGLRYVPDPRGLKGTFIDLYMTMMRSVEAGAGDCDDAAIAHATLLMAHGFRCGVCYCEVRVPEGAAGGLAGGAPTTWHVAPVVGLPRLQPREWLWLDTTVPNPSVGWNPGALIVREQTIEL